MGGMRSGELAKVDIKDIKEEGNVFVVCIPVTKTHTSRTFTIHDSQMTTIVRQYIQLRPADVKTS